jgi:hypothetical protein
VAIDLDIICIEYGIPVDWAFFDDLWFEQTGEFPREVWNWLAENKQPIYLNDDFKVWEIDKKDAHSILKHLNEVRGDRGLDYLSTTELIVKTNDWTWFDDEKRVFIHE